MSRSGHANSIGWILSFLALLVGLLFRRKQSDGWANTSAVLDGSPGSFDRHGERGEQLALADDPYAIEGVLLSAPPKHRAAREGNAPGTLDRAVVAEATIRLIVSDIVGTAAEIERLAREAGGSVLTVELTLEHAFPSGHAVIAVPVEHVMAVTEEIRSLSVVRAVVSSSYREQDVTSEVVDLEARLAAARRTEERYLALLERAERVQDMLRIEEEVQRIRSEIERLEGQRRRLAERRRLARIVVTFHCAETSMWRRIARAFGEGWREGLQALVGLARCSGRWLGIATPAALLFTVAGWLLRRVVAQVHWQESGTTRSRYSGRPDDFLHRA